MVANSPNDGSAAIGRTTNTWYSRRRGASLRLSLSMSTRVKFRIESVAGRIKKPRAQLQNRAFSWVVSCWVGLWLGWVGLLARVGLFRVRLGRRREG